ncbi:hypothetical protein [Rhizobium sp. Root1220]|uniref:hypothetical protein n=1 Tax=Rhizobium sp. Root1220 TaxID=1736432 RepID=UPI0006F1F057|nr:hypothetical protein [Rhizobium sp. Root1220]KQV64568.1 hypothetical protein ASC90_16980 [Rhizobium sp. Root1220]
MAGERYLYDYRSHKAVMYQAGEHLYPISGNKAQHWVSGDYIFSMETQSITYWMLGNDVYGHIGNGELTREPIYYFGG